MLLNKDELCKAIKEHRVIKFQYDNAFTFREVQPYALFVSIKDKTLLHAFQLVDESKPRQDPASRNFEIDKIGRLQLTDNFFEPDHSFSINKIDICQTLICTISTR